MIGTCLAAEVDASVDTRSSANVSLNNSTRSTQPIIFLLTYRLRWVLGFFKWAMGYEIGLILSIAGIIVIGYEMDVASLHTRTHTKVS